MMIPKNFVTSIEAECTKALAKHGIDVKRGIGTIQINEEFIGWVGLNVGMHNDFVRVNPFVGVHSPEIMELTSLAGGKRYRSNEIATFSIFLGTLCPHISQFIFVSEGDVRAESERLSSVIAEFAIPYMNEIAQYSTLLPLLEGRVPALGGYPQRYAAALYLSGARDRAIEFIESKMVAFADDGETEVVSALENLKTLMLGNGTAALPATVGR